MKITADIIKEGLTHCNLSKRTKCDNCPYARIELADNELCSERLAEDIISLIDQLQKTNEELSSLVADSGDAVIGMQVKCKQVEDALIFTRIDTIRSFQKKAKEKFISIDGTFECSEVEELIDETASEMKNEDIKSDRIRYYLRLDAKRRKKRC